MKHKPANSVTNLSNREEGTENNELFTVFKGLSFLFLLYVLPIILSDVLYKDDIRRVLKEEPDIKAALVQYSRQLIDDSYDIKEVIRVIKENADIPIVTDDNYAVMKVNKIGSELGGDLSCFSTFNLQGPEGIGVVTGKKVYIDKIRKAMETAGLL